MNNRNEFAHWDSEDDLDDLVEQWHTMPEDVFEMRGKPDIATFLGLTREEYFRWVEEPGWIDKKLAEE